MTVFYLILALLAGAGLPVQAAANARLSKAIGNPYAATTLQLSLAAALLLLAAAARGDLAGLSRFAQAEPWQWLAGLASAAYVIAGIVLMPRIGAVATVGLFITGQAAASLLLDGAGLLGMPRRAFTALTWLGIVAVALGIALVVRGQAPARGAPRIKAGWILLGCACGGLLPLQGAVNAGLARVLNAPLAVSLASFIVAAAGMAVVLGLLTAFGGQARPRLAGLRELPWWGWLGGVVGACYVTTVFSAMPVIGAAATVGATIAGQQIASVLIDRHGLLGLPRNAVPAVRLAGIAALLGGILAIRLS
ncbi:hypothetical protein B0920_21495 [Massilia sp. KIM]|uniref:DMT family transporter n=1 Tax=Massilia sp. KIM TaxID=1955422 RepID=UPI00098F2AD9|nr:DMT family transporter [Massilia sp. KIM]OON59856.1 hypothetical protein B0920_21495 [Massilia sp. KIM]